MPFTSGFTSRTAVKRERPLPTERRVPPLLTHILKRDYVRQPTGSPGGHGGEFAKASGAGGDTPVQPKLVGVGGSQDVEATQTKRFEQIKERWATLNNELLSYKDRPEHPRAKELITEQIAITKEIYSMDVDPGNVALEGIGKPGGLRDIVVIGAGPGGMNAAIHGGVEGYDTLLIDASTEVGGQAKFSARIENDPQAGYPAGVSGEQMANGMFAGVKRSRADTLLGVRVSDITYDPETEIKTLTLSNGQVIQSRTVILAGGLRPRRAGFPGEDSQDVHVLNGKTLAAEGVDGEVVVVGGSNGAAQAALAAADAGAKRVTVLSRSPLEKGMSSYQRDQIRSNPKIRVIHDEIGALETNDKGEATSITLKGGDTIPADEVGLFLGGLPNTEWLPGSITRTGKSETGPKGGFLEVDRDLETSMPGVFAVGDIRSSGESEKKQPGASKRKKTQSGSNGRITAAVGDAAIAVRNTYAYFEHLAELEQEMTAATKADDPHWEDARQRKAEMQAEVFQLYDGLLQLDLDNPWYGQTVEPESDEPEGPDYLSVLKWDESQHPRVKDGPKGGQFTDAATTGTPHGTGTPAQQEMQKELKKRNSQPVHSCKTAEEAAVRLLRGQNVEIQDTKDVHTVLKLLGEFALAAKKQGKDAPNFDVCNMTVKGVSLFCTEKIRTAEFPHGIPRIEMPQFKSKNPVPGSEASKLPVVDGEVDATDAFLKHLDQAGVKTNSYDKILARKLKASQAEMEGAKVAGMMIHPGRDPKKARITVSSDGYVIDGHHTWAAAVGRDAEDGDLDNDLEMDVVTVDLTMSEVYHVAKKWTQAFGLPAAGVKKREMVQA